MRNKLLIIDDDPILQDQLAWALKQDFELTLCSDRESGLKAAAGERPIELNVRSFFVNVTDSRIAVAENIASMLGFTADAVLASPFALIGSSQQIIDDLRPRRERWGFSYVIVGPDEVEAFAPVVEELAGN